MKDDQAMMLAALGDVDVQADIEDLTHSLEELRQQYTERFFTSEGLELLRSAGLDAEAP